MTRLVTTALALLLAAGVPAAAADRAACEERLDEARETYRLTLWEEVVALLDPPCDGWDDEAWVAAQELLIWSYIELHEVEAADRTVEQLVLQRPDYVVPAAGAERHREELYAKKIERARWILGDDDGDGVSNADDGCPATRRGSLVDAAGCPIGDVHRWELGLEAGLYVADRDLSNKSQGVHRSELTAGLRTGYRISERWAWFADATLADFHTNTDAGHVETLSLRSGGEWFFDRHHPRRHWLLDFGGGWADYELDSGESFDRIFASVAVGQRWQLGGRTRFRYELRADQTLDDDGLGGEDITTVQILLGGGWVVGSR